jgi:hypothetical protein
MATSILMFQSSCGEGCVEFFQQRGKWQMAEARCAADVSLGSELSSALIAKRRTLDKSARVIPKRAVRDCARFYVNQDGRSS